MDVFRCRRIVSSMLLEIIDLIGSSLRRGRANRKQACTDADLRARGVLAPAVVVSASTRGGRSSVDGTFIKIRYTVDVYPQGMAPFRTEFAHMSERRSFTTVMGKIVGEAGRQIWVTFDPTNPADMVFEYDEQERIARLQAAHLEAPRAGC
jgi:hypothetical protein